jgi:hypothetical protein
VHLFRLTANHQIGLAIDQKRQSLPDDWMIVNH